MGSRARMAEPASNDPLEAWCRGFVAGCDDLSINARPYAAGSELAAVWDDGWRAGEQRHNRPSESEAEEREEWRAYMRHSSRPAPS